MGDGVVLGTENDHDLIVAIRRLRSVCIADKVAEVRKKEIRTLTETEFVLLCLARAVDIAERGLRELAAPFNGPENKPGDFAASRIYLVSDLLEDVRRAVTEGPV